MSKDSPQISHLMFVDDLLLFAKANVVQVDVIKRCSNSFCEASGELVSDQRIMIYFFKGVSNQLASELATRNGFKYTNDIDKYLGTTIWSGRLTKHTYNFVLEKTHHRFSGWKSKVLSIAERVTLVNFILLSLPQYIMQSALIPKCIILDWKTSVDNSYGEILFRGEGFVLLLEKISIV